jgi:hypothetical protein
VVNLYKTWLVEEDNERVTASAVNENGKDL